MPAIAPGSLVLVTGASGYIAVETVRQFLAAGFPVRGTVRSDSKGQYVKNLFKDSKVPFEYVIVEDIAKPDAFDEAVKGVVGVAHTASPFHFKAEDPEALIRPAVDGTVGILKSIQKNNPNVQRVVITSSVASVVDDSIPKPHNYNDDEWNNYSPGVVEKQGKAAPAGDKYRASKTLAERAFWQFIKENQPSWDGATINPSLVIGPISQQVNSTSDLNTSVVAIYDWFTGNKSEADIPAEAPYNWVDVRDVAQGHVRALTVPEAGGNRFITSNGPTSPNEWVQIYGAHYPDRKTFPRGDPSKTASINGKANNFNGTKLTRVLGIQYHDLETSVKDTVDSLIKRFNL